MRLPSPALTGPAAQDERSVRVAVAGGPAFSFTYTDTIEALEAGGAEVIRFDPSCDTGLPPEVDGMIVGGGFPEVHAAQLAANEALLEDVRRRVAAGLVTWAECGGLLWLCRSLDGTAMVGAVRAEGRMTDRLHLGYRTARLLVDCPLGRAGTTLRGREFHYSEVSPAGDSLELSSRWGSRKEGFANRSLVASYFHYHPGGDPSPVEAFLAACRGTAARAPADCPT